MKTLLLTDSYDVTSDVIVHHVGCEKILRLNIDRLKDVELSIQNENFSIRTENELIESKKIAKVFWRKPFNCNLFLDNYLESEVRYIFREIFNTFSRQGKAILVIPNIENHLGKLVQMQVAAKYFHVPKWEVSVNKKFSSGSAVVKSLSSETTSDNKVIYTTKVEKDTLDPQYPWFIQDLIVANQDITAVFVNGKIFAYQLARKNGLIDWRKEINREKQDWIIHCLPKEMHQKIILFMNDLGLKFGRLDFLLSETSYSFLEVNPNGQWAWLDIENKNGLMEAMIQELSPDTENLASVKILNRI